MGFDCLRGFLEFFGYFGNWLLFGLWFGRGLLGLRLSLLLGIGCIGGVFVVGFWAFLGFVLRRLCCLGNFCLSIGLSGVDEGAFGFGGLVGWLVELGLGLGLCGGCGVVVCSGGLNFAGKIDFEKFVGDFGLLKVCSFCIRTEC